MSASQVFAYDDPFRPIHEYFALFGWIAAAILMVMIERVSDLHSGMFTIFIGICLVMTLWRGLRAIRMWDMQRQLDGVPVTFMTREELTAHTKGHEGDIFLGFGFPWTQSEAQLTHNVRRTDPDRLIPATPGNPLMGQRWLHGIGMAQEEPIYLPLDHTAGHMLLVGTTRSGKSRMLDTIIHQAVARGEAVIVWDPKGDKGLANSARQACIMCNKEDDFIFFHPAFPESSWRIDPLKNFNRGTELATRIASLIPSETGADPFTAHSQMILTNLCEGLLLLNSKPTLKLLKRFVDGGPEWLLVAACEAHFEKKVPGWREEVAPFISRGKGGKTDRDMAMIYDNYYREVVLKKAPSSVLEGLFSDFTHDKQHQQKMTASLTPVLTMLTAGSLGDLLSPDANDMNDRRPVTDFARIIRNGQVCYLGLDSLSDNMVGSAIGSMFVSDMTAVSGDRYNYFDNQAFMTDMTKKGPVYEDKKLRPVTLIIDEAAEIVSDKMVQLLNKAGGSNIRLIVATQTIADFAARLGSADKARMVLGNLNNKIILRTIDGETQTYLSESFPLTYVRHIEYTQATDAKSDQVLSFGYRLTEAMKETEVPLIAPDVLGCLANLEFFAQISGGHIRKGRIPILIDAKRPTLQPTKEYRPAAPDSVTGQIH